MTVSKKMDLLVWLSRGIQTGLNIKLRRDKRYGLVFRYWETTHRISSLEVTVRRINHTDVSAEVNNNTGCTQREISSKEMDVKLLSEFGSVAATAGIVSHCRIYDFFLSHRYVGKQLGKRQIQPIN